MLCEFEAMLYEFEPMLCEFEPMLYEFKPMFYEFKPLFNNNKPLFHADKPMFFTNILYMLSIFCRKWGWRYWGGGLVCAVRKQYIYCSASNYRDEKGIIDIMIPEELFTL